MPHKKLSIVIQAGGESTRIGEDKGLIQFQGVPLVEYILRQIEGFAAETFIVSNRPEHYLRFGVEVHKDVYPGKGALGGLYSAIYHASKEQVIVLACDMPFVDIPFLQDVVSLLPGFDAVVPRINGKFVEPFRAVYSKTCLIKIQKKISVGQLRVQELLQELRIYYVDIPIIESNMNLERLFFNINEANDLVRARVLAKRSAAKKGVF